MGTKGPWGTLFGIIIGRKIRSSSSTSGSSSMVTEITGGVKEDNCWIAGMYSSGSSTPCSQSDGRGTARELMVGSHWALATVVDYYNFGYGGISESSGTADWRHDMTVAARGECDNSFK